MTTPIYLFGGSNVEEISLRELIEIMLRGKWIIAVITLICILVGGIASIFMKPVYEAQTMLMISPIAVNVASENTDDNSFLKLVDTLSQYPQMTIDTYKEQVKAPVILDYIRKETGLESASLKGIASKIEVTALQGTNLLNVAVKDNSPEAAAKIANLISERFTQFVSETNQKQAVTSAEFIKAQQEKEKVNLSQALEELKKFVAQPRGPEELKQELDSKLMQLTEFKTNITQIMIDEEATRISFERGKAMLQKTPEKLKLDKSLISDEILTGIVKDKTGAVTDEIAGLKLTSEEINEVYTDMAKNVNNLEIQLANLTAQRKATENKIADRQREIEAIQAELAEKQQQYEILNHNVDLTRQTYDAYEQKYKEEIIKQSAETGKASIIIISQAIPPMNPIAPNKLMNVAIAAVAGLMLGAFVVFVKEYWKNSGSTMQMQG
jgi:uncharacterized protein involved in exopolysaccharide biosynthesis